MKEKVMQFKDIKVYYYVEGNPNHEAILMLHPAFADYSIFDQQFEALKDRYYLVAIDMVGHGKSQAVGAKVNMGDMPQIASKIMDVEKINRAHVLGVSLGSLVAQGIADQYPQRTKTVTVIGGYSIHKENKQIMKAQKKEFGKWIFYLIFSMKRFKAYITDTSSYSQLTREVFERSMKHFSRKQFMSMNGMNKIMRDKAEPVPYPLLIVCGEHDLQVVADFCNQWASIEPNAQYVRLPDAGHCANMDNAPLFNQTLVTFLQAQTGFIFK